MGLEVEQPESLEDPGFLEALNRINPEFAVLCAYGALVREPLLSRWQILNLHPSLLPRWRGAAPIERAIMAGDKVTGVSIIRLVEDLDAGPVCLSEEVAIEDDDDFGTLSVRLQSLGAALLAKALTASANGTLEFTDQAVDGITYAEKISASDRLIDPAKTATDLELQVRALAPHIGARFMLATGQSLGVRRAHAVEDGPSQGVLVGDSGELLLGCSSGALMLDRVIPPGSREMDAADWLRGAPTFS